MHIDLYPALEAATQAAHQAAGVLLSYFEQRDSLITEYKSPNDFVSQADRDAEKAIVQLLQQRTPQFHIIAEESGQHSVPQAQATWYIDPLDGTTNFLHGVPHFAISIALVAHQGTVLMPGMSPLEADTPVVAVVYDPIRQELFSAMYMAGCQLNGRPVRCTRKEALADSLLATGFPFRDFSFEAQYHPMLQSAIHQTRGVRRLGSAALDLAWVACGRFDGYWEMRLAPWDVAAGTLLVREAGGRVADLYQRQAWPQDGNIIATSRTLFDPLMAMLAPSLTP